MRMRRHAAVTVFPYDIPCVEAGGLASLPLLLRGPAQHQHGSGHGVGRQSQCAAHILAVFQNIPDVAAAKAEAFGGHHRVLCGDGRVRRGQQQVALPRRTGCAARRGKAIVPALAVRHEHQHHGCVRDEGLVVAQVGQACLQRVVGDVEDGVQHLVASRGGLHGRLEQRVFNSLRHRLLCEHADGFARAKRIQCGIAVKFHSKHLRRGTAQGCRVAQ